MTATEKTYTSYAEFWPFYLGQHTKRSTRLLHATGTALGLLCLAIAFFTFTPEWLIVAPVIGYGLPWLGHFLIENNHPATFTYPGWSLRGDLHMLWLMLTRRLDAEMAKYNLAGPVSG